LPKEVRFENFIDRYTEKTGKRVTERNCLVSTRTLDDLGVTTARINAMIEGLKKGVFIPTNRMSWWCNERWCGYARTCPFFTKSKDTEEN